MTIDLPTVVGTDGMVPLPPAQIWANLLEAVASQVPGYTASLPGSLVEDISSTDVAAIVEMDSARVETVNSLTPLGANAWLLIQLGQIYGVQQGAATLTSVEVVFTGTVNYAIPAGFVVSDGTYQYMVQDGGIIGGSGQSAPISCLATVPGTWAIPAGTVTEIVTSVPIPYTLSCSNPLPGTPGVAAQSETEYRIAVLQAGLAASQGMTRYLKTLLNNVPGVQARLVSVQQQTGGGWKVLVGGGDESQVANAIFQSVADISTLVGSQMLIDNITQANPGVVSTVLNHGYSNGNTVYPNGVQGMTAINGLPLAVTVIDEKTFSIGVNTTGFGAYTSGGILTPNNRNNYVSITDYPDVYQVVYVNPPQQTVTMTVTWNTTATNFVNGAAVAQYGAPALASYINAIPVGQPINLFDLQTAFQTAIASVLSPALLTRMVFGVSINGIGVSPEVGTGIIAGDPESYMWTDPTGIDITILQG